MPNFLMSQPICAPVKKDYYDTYEQKHFWPKADKGIALFAAPEGWMSTDENGNAKRFSNHIILEHYYKLDERCKRWTTITSNNDAIFNHFNIFDPLVFYVPYEVCYVLDFAAYFGGTDAAGTGECIRHKQLKITGDKIETRYGEEDVYSGALTWISNWATPYPEKTEILKVSSEDSYVYGFYFNQSYNKSIRLGEVADLHFFFGDGEYPDDFMAELSFDSGAMPTMMIYPDSGVVNWVGKDCTTVDGLSIFQPSANTHYEIVFYFNGTQFIGLVNGFVPSVSR